MNMRNTPSKWSATGKLQPRPCSTKFWFRSVPRVIHNESKSANFYFSPFHFFFAQFGASVKEKVNWYRLASRRRRREDCWLQMPWAPLRVWIIRYLKSGSVGFKDCWTCLWNISYTLHTKWTLKGQTVWRSTSPYIQPFLPIIANESWRYILYWL